jgi:hypothetical protein
MRTVDDAIVPAVAGVALDCGLPVGIEGVAGNCVGAMAGVVGTGLVVAGGVTA